MDIKEVCLTQTKIHEIFKNTALSSLENYIFCNCSFHNVSFQDKLNHVEFINCNFYDCFFNYDEVNDCTFSNNYFYNVNFCDTRFNYTLFIQCVIGNFSVFNNVVFNKSKFVHNSFYTTTFNIYSYDKIFGEDCTFQNVNFTTKLTNAASITSSYGKETILRESIIGYKKCLEHIVTLEIPVGAVVFSPNGKKYRTNKAKVLKIEKTFTGKEEERAHSCYNNMSYYVGDEITVHNFDLRYNVECSTGIHFFMTKEEAMNYSF